MASKQTKTKGNAEEEYQMMQQHEHILKLPDTYMGSIKNDMNMMWVYDDETKMIVKKDILYNPGLFKIFDEIIVNARDQTVRCNECRTIKVSINKEEGIITVWNDGSTIPIKNHEEHKIWIPEMIFGRLLTSSNYNQTGKTVGGRNGLGSKLTNLYSRSFCVELVDTERKKKYTQLFENNMYKINPPTIVDVKPKTKSYFQVTFKPDYERFGSKCLTNDMYTLFKKRIYDLAICTNNCKIYFNDELIKIESFMDYVKLYYDKFPSTPIYEEVNDRWKVCAIYDSNNEYGHVSFVNGISTFKGGSHINHVLEQITRRIVNYIKEKNKLTIKGYQVKEKLSVFIEAVVEDPAFSSQTKEELTTKVADFGSKCELSDEFIDKLTKTGLVDEVVKMAEVKEMLELKKTDGKKTQSIRGIDKYDPALWAGTQKAHMCRLILTEGDSAKSFALAGTEVIGRERYGVFPLKGKPLNVREATAKQILNNEEFNNIKKILGLKQNKKYTSTKGLNYGGILVLSDQDEDGHHIKGLLINMIHHFWPSLLINVPDFIQTLSTPIVKAFKKSDTKKQNPIIFFTLTEYEQWKEELGSTKNYDIKYYKGLGTSKEDEAKESFVEFDKKVITYKWEHTEDMHINDKKDNDKKDNDINDENTNDNDDESDDGLDGDYNSKSNDAITLAFQKSRANERKTWLFNYNRYDIITSNIHEIPYSDFINKVMKHFSNSDNVRSIADLADGMKPSQRKILYACFKKNIVKNEIKVAQLAGYVSEIAEYHHGEASLQGAIVKMAHNFVGANNINLLTPNGNFGSRRLGGADAASARYIFTQLNHLSKLIFRSEDDAIYNYIDEDGTLVEPERYAPIIPMILVNGTMGIGTGFSTDIPPFNPSNIMDNLLKMLNGEDPDEMKPWFKGFKGTVKAIDDKIYSIGRYEIIDESNIKITELPVGTWTEKYKDFLESIMINDKNDKSPSHIITKYQNLSSNNTINFIITFVGNHLQNLIKSNTIEKKLKLISSIPITNMYMYNTEGKITKYETIEDILLDFYKYRLKMYQTRKVHMLKELLNDLEIIKYRVLFIQYVLAKKIILDNKRKTEVYDKLVELKFPKLSPNVYALEEDKSYDYLNMSIWNLTLDKIEDLNKEFEEKKQKYEDYDKTSVEELWKRELIELQNEYNKWIIEQDNSKDNTTTKKTKSVKAVKKNKK
jgi:DNA topoisomerase-2